MAGVGQKTSGFQDYALRSAYQVSGVRCQALLVKPKPEITLGLLSVYRLIGQHRPSGPKTDT